MYLSMNCYSARHGTMMQGGRAVGTKRERPKGSGHWQLRVYAGREDGADIFSTKTVTGTGRDAARELARFEVEVAARHNPTGARGTIGELLEDWWASKQWPKAGSKAKARSDLDCYLIPHLGDMKVARFDQRPIETLYRGLLDGRLAKRAKPLAPGSVARLHATLHAALEWGVFRGRIGWNPAGRVDAPNDPPTKVRAPEPDEVAALLAAADPEFAVFVRLAAGTGRRLGDLLGITLPQIRPTDRAIQFDQVVVRAGNRVLVEPLDKNGRATRVEVDDTTWAAVGAQRQFMDDRAAAMGTRLVRGAFLFSDDPQGRLPWRPDSTSRKFRVLAETVGIGHTLHSLRHFHITELLTAGVDVETVAQRVGDDPRTIYKTYSHFRPRADRRAADAIGAVLAGRPAGLTLLHGNG